MPVKPLIHRLALWGETAFERLRPRRRPERPVIDAYRGHRVTEGLLLRGRVLAELRRTTPDPEQSRWQNLREMAALFFTDEVAGITVEATGHEASAQTDGEGYFSLVLPGQDLPAGWHVIPVRLCGVDDSEVGLPVLVPSELARVGVISDIDDTMIQTGAYSLLRNLWTTFTGSALTRKVFPDSIVLMDHLSAHGRNPVFYVSSSPWNLHAFLDRVFAKAGLVPGPLYLRDYGIGKDQFITGTHGGHKGSAIDAIMAANPGLPFVLVGDTGQEDAHVYLEAAHRHGGRVRAVILREPGPGPDAASREALAHLARLGVTVHHGPDLSGAAEALARAGIEV